MKHAIAIVGLIGLMLGWVTPGFAQEDTMSGKMLGFGGMQWINVTEMNRLLLQSGYPQLTDEFYHYGALYQVSDGLLITEIEYSQIYPQKVSLDVYQTVLGANYLMLNVGFGLVDTDWLQMYPIFGVSRSGMTLEVTEEKPFNFESVISNATRLVELTKVSYVIQAGIGMDFSFEIGDGTPLKMTFGVRAGYFYTVYSENWMANGISITGGPNTGLDGWYVRFLIGISE